MSVKTLIHSMRLRTLPLSLTGVVCGGLLSFIIHHSSFIIRHCRHLRPTFGVCRMYTVMK